MLPSQTLSFAPTTDYLALLLWTLYGLGVLVFGIKFLYNLYNLIQKIKNNPKYKLNRIVTVLLSEAVVPHTFFKYIFLNKQAFEAQQIPKEVLLHEKIHVKEKHSWDVLFIEILQIVLWFNPLIYFIKHAIKLNHEFLADRGVLNQGVHSSHYQKILLTFSSNLGEPQLVNSINYASIKKRFTVMKTKTSKQSIRWRTLLLLPLLAVLLYGFVEIKTVELPKLVTSFPQEQLLTRDDIEIQVTSDNQILVQGQEVPTTKLASYLLRYNQNLSKSKRTKVVRALIWAQRDTPRSLLTDIENSLHEYGVATIDIVGPEKPPFVTDQKGAAKKEVLEYNKLAKKYNAQSKEKRVIPSQNLKGLEGIYGKMSEKQKAEAQPFPGCPPPPEQEPATKKQVAEYNALAKEYNTMIKKGNIWIKKSEVDQMEHIYNLMTTTQKENAEPYPDFPSPPPASKAPEATSEREETGITIKTIIEEQDPYDVVGGNININQPTLPEPPHSMDVTPPSPSPVIKKGEKSGIPAPPVTWGWTVTSGANRNSRPQRDGTPLPPVAPTLALHTNTDSYSKELKTAIRKYLEKNNELEKAVGAYGNEQKGNPKNLWNVFNEAMALYVTYYDLAHKENKFVQPFQQNASDNNIPQPPAIRVQKGEISNIPSPPLPPKPKSPIDHIVEMAKKGAIFYYEDRKITSDKAIDILKNNDKINIDSRGSTSKRPIVKLSTEPIKIEN